MAQTVIHPTSGYGPPPSSAVIAEQSAFVNLAAEDDDLFEGGTPRRLLSHIGLVRPGWPNLSSRMAFVILLCWVPLAVLSALHGNPGSGEPNRFIFDFAAHARYLIAAPLLILAEDICLPRMSRLAMTFLDAGLVVAPDRERFDAAIMSTRKWLDSTIVEIATVVVAYLIAASVFHAMSPESMPAWLMEGPKRLSAAGWWGLLVSLPVLLVLQLGWLWRLMLWTRFLWLVSRLDLKLVPSHPDGAAGLRFVGYSAQAFTVLAFAFGCIAAGTVAVRIAAGASIASYQYAIAGFVATLVVLLNAPLLVFLGTLLREWRRGTFEYGALADGFGREFERKWFSEKTTINESVLERQDFSAATDLYQVVDRVYAMGFVPIHMRSIGLLAIAAVLPFVPVVFMALPFDVIAEHLAGLLL